MTTIKDLIDQLKMLDENEPVAYQYVLADSVGMSEADFAPIAEYLMNNNSFGEESANFFTAWVIEAQDVLANVPTQTQEN